VKKVGGVKIRPGAGDSPPPRRHVPESDSTQPVTLLPKKVGAIKASARAVGTSVAHKLPCCDGEYILGMWVHSGTCPETVVIWKAHGKTKKDWRCPEGCEPQELPSCYTHGSGCAWWDRHSEHVSEAVPFHREAAIIFQQWKGEALFDKREDGRGREADDDDNTELPF
jgi:hypothetical protein